MQNIYTPDVNKKLDRLRERAKQKKVKFSISRSFMDGLLRTSACPCCANCLTFETNSEFELTVDRLVPVYGYTEGNVVALCRQCNTLKDNKSPKELTRVGLKYLAIWMEKECLKRNLKWKTNTDFSKFVVNLHPLDLLGRFFHKLGFAILHRKALGDFFNAEWRRFIDKEMNRERR